MPKRTRRRDPAPFWWEKRGCYYIQLGKKQIRLDPDLTLAKQMARKLIDAKEKGAPVIVKEVSSGSSPLVAEIFDGFIEWTNSNRAATTADAYQARLGHVVKSLVLTGIAKTLTVDQFRPHHVSAAITSHPDWSDNYKGDVARACERAITWAVQQGLIDRNPILGMDKPGRRAREMVVSPKEYEEILSKIKYDELRDLVEITWETGLRVQEVRLIEAKFVDLKNQRVVLPVSKSKGKKVVRVVYLGTNRSIEILAQCCERYPEGPVLRNRRGGPWTKDSINSAFCRLQKKLGVKYHLGALRKSFATEALKNGVDAVTVAHLMGHRDTSMIARFYGHVHQDPEHMARSARKARGQD